MPRALLPGRLSRDELRLCNCARCGRSLLGESHEHLRTAAALGPKTSGVRSAGPMACLPQLPPPVAGRVFGRPYCDECIELPPVRVTGPTPLEGFA